MMLLFMIGEYRPSIEFTEVPQNLMITWEELSIYEFISESIKYENQVFTQSPLKRKPLGRSGVVTFVYCGLPSTKIQPSCRSE